MFFLAVLTWATLTTEAPVIVSVYKTLQECEAARNAKNATWPPPGGINHEPPPKRFVCLEPTSDA